MLDVTRKVVDTVKDRPLNAETFNKTHEVIARSLKMHKKDLAIDDMYDCLKSVFKDLVYATDQVESIVPFCANKIKEAFLSGDFFFDFSNLNMEVADEKENMLFSSIDLIRMIQNLIELNGQPRKYADLSTDNTDNTNIEENPFCDAKELDILVKKDDFITVYCGTALNKPPLDICDLPNGAWNVAVKTEDGIANVFGCDEFVTSELLSLKTILAGFAIATQKKSKKIRFCHSSEFLNNLLEKDLKDLIKNREENGLDSAGFFEVPSFQMIKSIANSMKRFDCEFCYQLKDDADESLIACLDRAKTLVEEKS